MITLKIRCEPGLETTAVVRKTGKLLNQLICVDSHLQQLKRIKLSSRAKIAIMSNMEDE